MLSLNKMATRYHKNMIQNDMHQTYRRHMPPLIFPLIQGELCMIKKAVFLALTIPSAALVSYPTISNAHRLTGPVSLFDQH
ncbi:hypothetical protein CFR77_06705 [Komagataeibacter sucrofermentans]|uniref:Uncharacterized protein n=1 Tax=Komagataeibacter sucrofermentans TaxID=1053551 RepID=A0A318QIB4_9PROT|nr:hypothetical protein CFR77_06705 [Komagataeibacter sucrofermentans]